MEEDKSFGVFGEGVDPVHKSRKKRRRNALLFFFFLSVLTPIGIKLYREAYVNYLEKIPPTIRLVDPPEGISKSPSKLTVEIEDDLSGLDEVVVRYEQNNRLKDLKKIKLRDKNLNKKTISVELDGKKLGLLAGEVRVFIVAFDKSFWSNSRKADIFLNVDYTSPKIEVVTKQHNAVHGGAELVFYQLRDGKDEFVGISGVKIGGGLYVGFPAKLLDKAFEAVPDLYFSLFPVPLDYDPNSTPIRLFARDGVGNITNSKIYYRVKELKRKSKTYELDPVFLETKAEELYKIYLSFLVSQGKLDSSDKYEPATDIEELVKRFREVNVEFRRDVNRSLSKLLSKPRTTRYWTDKFSRQGGFTRAYSFGEMQHYTFEGLGGGSVLSDGTGMKAKRGKRIVSGQAGIVIFSDLLGPYGQTVIIDHGFGLTSLYANLEEIKVNEGQKIEIGDELGILGNSGLFQEPVLHYEIRLQGVPVRPEEWWDKRWIKEHLEAKIKDVKKSFRLSGRRG